MKIRALAGLLLLLLLPKVHAMGASTSYSTWAISGRLVTLQFVLPVNEARRLTENNAPAMTVRELGQYVLKHVSVRSTDGNCPAVDQGYDLGVVDPRQVGAGLQGFEIFFLCAAPGNMVLHNEVLFDRASGHVNFARVQTRRGSVDQLFTAANRQINVPAAGLPPATALSGYAKLGALHVLGSALQLCFLLAAAALIRRRRDAGYLLGALALGYLASLALSAGGWVLPRINFVEAFLGLLVAILGLAMTRRQTSLQFKSIVLGWSGLLLLISVVAAIQSASLAALFLVGAAVFSAGFLALMHWNQRRDGLWISLAAVFAFLDGLALSAMLPEVHFPTRAATRLLSGFDVGAVLAEVLLLGAATGAMALLRRKKLAAGRMLAADVAAACLAGVGAFWLVSRVWS